MMGGMEMMVNAVIKSLGFSTDEVKGFANDGMQTFKTFAHQMAEIHTMVSRIDAKLSGSALTDDPYLKMLPKPEGFEAQGTDSNQAG
jgi:hypothetical protein